MGAFIAADLQPFSVVTDAGFRQLLKTLDPRYVVPSRSLHISMTLWFPTYITQRARLLKTICLKHKTSHWPQIAGPPGPQRVTWLWRCITCRTKEALQQCFLFTFLIQCYTTVNARRHFNKVFFIYIFVCFSSFYIFYTLPYSVITVVAKFDEK